MFRVMEVLKVGWWNSVVIVTAEASMRHQEKRMRFSGLHVARIETWQFAVEKGEQFKLIIPRSVRKSGRYVHDGRIDG
jgi:hypothetical protein